MNYLTYTAEQMDAMLDELRSGVPTFHAAFCAKRALGEPVAVTPITSAEFRRRSMARSRKSAPGLNATQRRLALYALGLTGEAGEVADEVKKHLFHDKPLDRDHLLAECGDVLWYLDRLLHELDATIEVALAANDAKLAARYPDGWDAAEKHYDHGASA